MRWILLTLALGSPIFAQSIVLTEAFSDSTGKVHFAVTKVVHLDGAWKKHPLEVGTIIDPPRSRNAYPLRRFGETVLFVLPKADNLRAYWSYNVHGGFVLGMQGRTLTDVVGEFVATANVREQQAAALLAAAPQPQRRIDDIIEESDAEKQQAMHERMVEALQALAATNPDSKSEPNRQPVRISARSQRR